MIPDNPCGACYQPMPPDRAGWLCTDCANNVNQTNGGNNA